MALRELNLEGLSTIDGGRVDAAVNRHLKRAIADCEDRPGDKTPRKVVLTMLVRPVMLQDGAVTDVNVECEVSSTVPKHVSKPVDCRIKNGQRAVFNDMSEGDVDQMTIDEA
jgi:hypothetical protein